ncbi:NUDIX hydrolase [Aurantibacter aestuarii]|uniref:Hydrolase n=1 Tax=Aurantibacter aestuarii TaxID=1266046 RepID=A0A2T1N834_9FLAO|nr:NUDIX domain-containing protein [Aurantibacter aestuarii]PSG88034.1 hydrolase [Aurantibacter aestuarii]
MADELIDIANKKGQFTGDVALKSEVHKKGLYHHTAHVWLYTLEGEILLQQRAKTKAIHPLLWDVSVAGHVDSGETIKQGALREMKEELGYDLEESDLIKIGVFDCFKSYDFGIIDNEFHNTYIAELKVPISQLTPCKTEVEAIKLVNFKTFENLLSQSKTNLHFIESNKAYYLTVLKTIKQQLAL